MASPTSSCRTPPARFSSPRRAPTASIIGERSPTWARTGTWCDECYSAAGATSAAARLTADEDTGGAMYHATKDSILPTTIIGSLPRPSWYTVNLGTQSFLDAMTHAIYREQYTDALCCFL